MEEISNKLLRKISFRRTGGDTLTNLKGTTM